MHGGHEHYQLPSPRMQETYRFFVDAGADVVVNHHQHCYSGYEIYNGTPIFYGLGNFCFDDNKSNATKWNYGYMIKIEFKDEVRFEIIPYEQSSGNLSISTFNDESFKSKINKINNLISNPGELRREVNNYYTESQNGIKIGLFPISNLIIRILFYKKIISPKFPRKWLLRLEDYVMCESHRDKLFFMFWMGRNK